MSDEFTRDLAKLAQALRDEADQCELLGINKPAALLREAAAVIQVDANMQAIDEFAEVTSVGHLSELVDDMRRQLHMLADEWEDHTELDAGPVATTLREIAGDKPPALPPLRLDQIAALEAGCGHAAVDWDTRVSLVRAVERVHGIGA